MNRRAPVDARADSPATCREVLRQSALPLCEWDPVNRRLARLGDRFHSCAMFVMGPSLGHGNGEPDPDELRVCPGCLTKIKDRPFLGRILR